MKKLGIVLALLLVLAFAIGAFTCGGDGEESTPATTPTPAPATALFTGTVFEDRNSNGLMDEGETGISDILVSNGIEVTPTDKAGAYHLSQEGYFIFITTPSDYVSTTPWYQAVREHDLDFGLAPSPDTNTSGFTFVQMTDIHIDTEAEHINILAQAVDEINGIAPGFVVATGDLVKGADKVSVTQARQWFDTYDSISSGFDMPLYNAVGNHDVVGIHSEEADEIESGYNEEMHREHFGPTYYSFDWGSYHCIILDPNELVDRRQLYRIPGYQLEWLKQDLAHRQDRPLLVFFHEPTQAWENNAETLDVLRQHETYLFAGHWHQDILMDSHGIPEQVTGSLCGEFWYGPCSDGRPAGYRIVFVGADGISSFYKGIGLERQIDIITPNATISGETTIAALVYAKHSDVREASCRIDDGEPLPMLIKAEGLWCTATVSWDTTHMEQGYHNITVEVRDEMGTFSIEKEVKVTEEQTVPLGELIGHFEAYQGQYTKVRGQQLSS